jgi:hypothetical protein
MNVLQIIGIVFIILLVGIVIAFPPTHTILINESGNITTLTKTGYLVKFKVDVPQETMQEYQDRPRTMPLNLTPLNIT